MKPIRLALAAWSAAALVTSATAQPAFERATRTPVTAAYRVQSTG